uniref:Uncharacterized protein n=1 Tax=Oryza glumipatula TaxID=40148 RepID=A0A0D9YU66_9ORYZ
MSSRSICSLEVGPRKLSADVSASHRRPRVWAKATVAVHVRSPAQPGRRQPKARSSSPPSSQGEQTMVTVRAGPRGRKSKIARRRYVRYELPIRRQ